MDAAIKPVTPADVPVYRKLGMRSLDDWVLLRLNSEGLRRLAVSPPIANLRVPAPGEQ